LYYFIIIIIISIIIIIIILSSLSFLFILFYLFIYYFFIIIIIIIDIWKLWSYTFRLGFISNLPHLRSKTLLLLYLVLQIADYNNRQLIFWDDYEYTSTA
jgi:hypothetical protein